MIAEKSGARCLASLRTYIRLFVQSVILYSFLDMPLCGILLTHDLTSVGLLFFNILRESNMVTESLVVIQP